MSGSNPTPRNSGHVSEWNADVDFAMLLSVGISYSDLTADSLAPSLDPKGRMMSSAMPPHGSDQEAQTQAAFAFAATFARAHGLVDFSTRFDASRANRYRAAVIEFGNTFPRWRIADDSNAYLKVEDGIIRMSAGLEGFVVEHSSSPNAKLSAGDDSLGRPSHPQTAEFTPVARGLDIDDVVVAAKRLRADRLIEPSVETTVAEAFHM